MDSGVYTPQSVLLPAGYRMCAALLTVNKCSVLGHAGLVPQDAMRSVLTTISHLCGRSGKWPSGVHTSRASTDSRMLEANRWLAVQCCPARSTVRSRCTNSEVPGSKYSTTRRVAGVCVCC